MYVVKRQNIYQFRKQIPKSCRAFFEQDDLRVSLRTSQAQVANRRALGMLVQVSKIFELLRSQKPADESRRLAVQMLEEAVTCRGLREDETRWRFGLPGACEH